MEGEADNPELERLQPDMATDTEKKDPDDAELKTFDDVLVRIGYFGNFQRWIVLVHVLISFAVGSQNLCTSFSLYLPDHRCRIEGLSNDTFEVQSPFHQSLINRTIPLTDDGEYDECHVYDLTPGGDGAAKERKKKECSSWVYSKSLMKDTLVMDVDLVCKRKIFRSHSNMMLFAGKFIGAISQGFLSDIFGRRVVMMVTAVGVLAVGIWNALVDSVWAMFVSRFLTGVMTTACYLAIYVLTIEYVGPADRTKVSFLNRMSFCLGQFFLAPVAYLERDWHKFQFILTIPSIITVLTMWMVPESSRWLIAKGRIEQAEKTMQTAAKRNNRELPPGVIAKLKIDHSGATESSMNLFKEPALALRWTVLYIQWAVIAMSYYGLTLNASNLGGNVFMNFALSVFMDVIGTGGTGFLVEKVSRKYFFLGSLIFSGLPLVGTIIPLLAGVGEWSVAALSLVGKMAMSVAFFLVYTYTAELFPTKYRAFGMGSCSMIARIGGVAAPYVGDLNTYVDGTFGMCLPQLVFGGASIFAGLLALILPETRNRKMPETIADAKNFKKVPPEPRTPEDDTTDDAGDLELAKIPQAELEPRDN